MSLTAHITVEDETPWLYITAPPIAAGGDRLCIFDAPINLRDKHTTKLEIDFAHEQTGMPLPDLYDAFRLYQRSAWARDETKPMRQTPTRTNNLRETG